MNKVKECICSPIKDCAYHARLRRVSPSPTKEWAEEFDEIFVKGFRLTKIQQQNVRTIKSFISSLLKEQRAQCIEEIEDIVTTTDREERRQKWDSLERKK